MADDPSEGPAEASPADVGPAARRRLAAPLAGLQVWMVDLDQPFTGGLRPDMLPPDEQERAARFRFDEHRQRFLRARIALREILGDVLRCPPESIGLLVTEGGKPELLRPMADLHFNLSHSDGLALIAVSSEGPVGVDLEWMRPVQDLAELAREHFTAQEAEGLLALPADERLATFLRVWTRKEACLKAWGVGLEWPGRDLDVGLGGRRVVRPPRGRSGAQLRLASLALPENVACEAAVSLGMHDGFR